MQHMRGRCVAQHLLLFVLLLNHAQRNKRLLRVLVIADWVIPQFHDDVIKWKHFPRYWPFVRGIHRSPVTGEFPTQRLVTRSFDVYFDLRPNEWLSKQSWAWWFETLSCSLWRHRNAVRDSTNMQIYIYTIHAIWYTWTFIRQTEIGFPDFQKAKYIIKGGRSELQFRTSIQHGSQLSILYRSKLIIRYFLWGQ